MKKLLALVIVVCMSLLAKGQSDTSSWFKNNDIGWRYERFKARKVLLIPSDTAYQKYGIAQIGSKLFAGNGSWWTQMASTTTIDTSSIQPRFVLQTALSGTKLNISDTAGKWLGYGWLASLMKYADTASIPIRFTNVIALANSKEVPLTFSTGLSRSGNTITNTITQYTDALSRAALSFSPGSGGYNSGTGVITIPTNTNQLTNGAGFITGYTETDPTIYSWAKASVKPSYGWSEITSRPTLLSQFTNDLGNYGGFLTTETDPTIYAWAKASTKPSYAWSEITSRPTALSQFTNDLGNYGGWITGITSGMVTTALGYTPYNSSNPAGYITGVSWGAITGTVPTWNQSTTGNAATATIASNSWMFAGIGYYGNDTTLPSGAYVMAYDNTSAKWHPIGKANMKTWFGFGSAAYTSSGDYVAYRTFGTAANNNTGDFYATGSTVANSTLWNGYGINLATYGSNAGDFLNYDNSLGIIKPFSTAQILTKLGLPSGGETLATVTGRGNITSTMSWFNNGIGFDQAGVRSWTISAGSGNLTLGSGDGGGAFNVNTTFNVSGRGFFAKSSQTSYSTAALEVYTADGASSEVGISFHRGGYSAGFLSHGSYGGLRWNGDQLLMSSMSSVSPTASSLVLRDGSGYVEGVYFKSTNTGVQGSGLAAITGKYITGDGYMYEFNAAAVKAFLSLPNGGETLATVTGRGASTSTATYFNGGAYGSNFGVGEMSFTSNQLYRASANEMYLNYSGTGQTIIGNSAGITLNANISVSGNIQMGDYLFLNNKLALRGTDGFLRLNQNGEFSSGIYTPYNLRADGTTYFGGSSYYVNSSTANLPPTTINGSATVNGYVYPYAVVNQSSVGADNGFGIFFGTYAEGSDYVIRRRAGAWSSPYQPLDIKFYTGIRLGADYAYGGTIFYSSSNLATPLFSIGNGDLNIRMEYAGQKLITRNPGSGIDVEALQANYFGYSSSYAVLQVGDTRGNRSIAFGVDLTGNPSGSFNGGGLEYIWKNTGRFITPNASNNGYNLLYSWDNVGGITLGNHLSTAGYNITAGTVYGTTFIGAGSSLTSLPSNTALYPTLNQNTTGNATTATSTTLLASLANYTWNNSTAPSSYPIGIQNAFVSAYEGFPDYGSVMTMRTYSGSVGGVLQLYTPYGDSYGGTSLRFRNGDYSSGAWTAWKTIIDNTNIGSQTVNRSRYVYDDGANLGGADWKEASQLGVKYSANSSKLYSTDAGYAYGSSAPYYGYLTYNNPRNHWEFKVSPATPSDVWVSRSGTSDNSLLFDGSAASEYLRKGASSYYQASNWIQINGGFGLYWPNSVYPTNYGGTYVQINPNYGTTSYGSLTIYGRQNGYAGITFGDGGNSTIMYDNGGNGGGYTAGSGWHYYWQNSTGLLGIGGSTVTAGYKVTANGSLMVGGKITASNEINSGGNIYTAANYGYGLVGLYDSYKFQAVYAMGDAYKVAYDGSTPGNLYGISWVHSNAGGQAALISGHHMLVMANGLTQTAIGSGIWTNGAITATAFYQSSDIRLKNVVRESGDMIVYSWKDKRDELLHYGYSAQQIEINMPDQVNTGTNGLKSVNYIEVHTKKINDLEKEVAELKALLIQIKNQKQ